MPRGTQLGQVVTLVRHYARHSTNAAVGTQLTDPIKADIRRNYRWLHRRWDWPHLRQRDADKTMSAGSYTYSYATDIDPDRVEEAWYLEPGTSDWIQVPYGIDPADYNYYDSENDERSDPVRKWERASDTQFEVWPIPATSGGILRMVGQKAPLIS